MTHPLLKKPGGRSHQAIAECGDCGAELGEQLSDLPAHDVPEIGQTLCLHCFSAYKLTLEDQATIFAREACEITASAAEAASVFATFDTDGLNPPRLHATHYDRYLNLRGTRTNHDELVRRFDADSGSISCKVFRNAIKQRIDGLIAERAQAHGIHASIN